METGDSRTDDETGSPTQIMPPLGHGSPLPKAGTQPVLDRSGEAPFLSTPCLIIHRRRQETTDSWIRRRCQPRGLAVRRRGPEYSR